MIAPFNVISIIVMFRPFGDLTSVGVLQMLSFYDTMNPFKFKFPVKTSLKLLQTIL